MNGKVAKSTKAKRSKFTNITQFFQVVRKEPDQSESQEDAEHSESNQPCDMSPVPPEEHPKIKFRDKTVIETDQQAENQATTSTFEFASPSSGIRPIDISLSEPNQPYDTSVIPPKQTKSQNICFQQKWYRRYPWIHYVPEMRKVVCFQCAKANAMGLLNLAKTKEPSFLLTGFDNWKKYDRFESHQNSETHRYAVYQLRASKKPPVNALLDTAQKKQQEEARACLVKIFTTVRFLLRQGLAFRGHKASEGNIMQLLKLRAEDDSTLSFYLNRKINYTCHQSQEEMMKLFSHHIVREIARSIQGDGVFAVMVDGTQDITGKEQESVCFRHVDSELHIHEHFIGLYQIPDTTGGTIANMIIDVITRLCLSIRNLRAQTYDGASNMSGKYSGCQAKIKQHQPLALAFHCGSHLANLVMQQSITACPLVRDAVQWVHELGVMLKRSGKNKALFEEIALITDESNIPTIIRPLCPTRWLCRLAPIDAAIRQYQAIISTLEEISQSGNPEVATKANGLLDRFQKGETLLGLMMALKPIAVLEQLNSALQAQSANISGMMSAVATTAAQLQSWRNQEVFTDIFQEAAHKVGEYELRPLELPRQRQPPKRYTGQAVQHHPVSVEDHYRVQYVQLIDMVATSLKARYDENQTDLSVYRSLESMIITGEVNDKVDEYPDFDKSSLAVQLQMFKHTTKVTTLQEAKIAYREMSSEVKALFPQVCTLLKLLLVCPVTSCENERSFSALRRLKTWLRNTMTQQRLNCVCVCNVHKESLDNLNVSELAKEFAGHSVTRRNIFGNFTE